MKKILLLALAVSGSALYAQTTVYSYGFDEPTDQLEAAGWERTNQSEFPTETLWDVADYTTIDEETPWNQNPIGQDGALNSFALVNYTSTDFGDISNWLITPAITVENGDVVSFYTRLGAEEAAYADRLQLRMSTSGSSSIIPSAGSEDVGSFTELMVDVNPNLNLDDYPLDWGQYTYTVSGLSGSTEVRFAFRYYVFDGGPVGENSDIIGLDTFEVTRSINSTQDFFKNNFAMYPSPASDILNISSTSGKVMNTLTVTDINGRTVLSTNLGNVNASQVSVGNLNSGIYFATVETPEGKGTTKFIKL